MIKHMSNKALFIENIQDYHNIDKNFLNANDYEVFSFDIELNDFLKEKKISTQIADTYLSKDDHDKIYQYTVSLYNWYDQKLVPNDLEFEKLNILSLFDTAEFHHLLIREIYRFITIKRILEKYNFNQIVANSHLITMIKSISTNQIDFIQIKNSKHNFSIPFENYSLSIPIFGTNISIKISRNTYTKIKNHFEFILGKLFGLWFDSKTLKKSLLFLEFNIEQYSKLFLNLKKYDKNVILINMRRPAIWNINSIKILKKYNCKILTPDFYLSKNEKKNISKLTSIYQNKLNKLWMNESIFQQVFLIENCSIWSTINTVLLKIYQQRLEDYIKLIIFSKKISQSIGPNCIVSLNVFGETEKAILNLNNESRSILLEHGFTNYVPELSLFDTSNMYTLFKGKMALWGNIQKEYIVNQHHIPEEKLIVVGSPRHDDFKKKITKTNNKKTILIIPGQYDEPNGIYDTESFRRYEDLLKKLFLILKHIPNVTLIVKLHPSLQKNNMQIKKIIEKINPNIQIKQFSSILSELESCDTVINIFPEIFPSTVLLEGLLLRKPILNISLHKYSYKFAFEKDHAVLSIFYDDDLEKHIHEILFDKNLRSLLIENGIKHAERYLANFGHASEELANILNSY